MTHMTRTEAENLRIQNRLDYFKSLIIEELNSWNGNSFPLIHLSKHYDESLDKMLIWNAVMLLEDEYKLISIRQNRISPDELEYVVCPYDKKISRNNKNYGKPIL